MRTITDILFMTIFPMSAAIDFCRALLPPLGRKMDKGKITRTIRANLGLWGLLMGRYAVALPVWFVVAPLDLTIKDKTFTNTISIFYWLLLGSINVIDWITSKPRKRRLRKWASERVQKLVERMKSQPQLKPAPIPV